MIVELLTELLLILAELAEVVWRSPSVDSVIRREEHLSRSDLRDGGGLGLRFRPPPGVVPRCRLLDGVENAYPVPGHESASHGNVSGPRRRRPAVSTTEFSFKACYLNR